jgi:hypothetical protein
MKVFKITTSGKVTRYVETHTKDEALEVSGESIDFGDFVFDGATTKIITDQKTIDSLIERRSLLSGPLE